MKRTNPLLSARFLALLVITGAASCNVACSSEREVKETQADATRVSNIMRISYEIALFKIRHERIPTDLTETDRAGEWNTPVDPVSGKPYEYRTFDKKHYELCATFDQAIEPRQGELPGISYGDGLAHGYGYWVHGGGHQCVRRSLD